jgi:hypothetical protein
MNPAVENIAVIVAFSCSSFIVAGGSDCFMY